VIRNGGALLSDSEPITLRPRTAGHGQTLHPAQAPHPGQHGAFATEAASRPAFNRQELNAILALYGRKVARGEWRDYAIDFHRDKAIFSVFRRASEVPLFRIEKDPRLARRQGAFSVVAAGGLILKRGHDLIRVLGVLEDKVQLVKP
jgi:hypothetical protein